MFASLLSHWARAVMVVTLAASTARAGVTVQGTVEAIRLEADNASIEEVLGALHDAQGLTYASKVPILKQVSGVYVGPLSRVLTSLLRDMNFVIAQEGKAVHVLIISRGEGRTTHSAAPLPTAAKADPVNPQFPAGFFPPPTPSGAPSVGK